MAIHIWSFNPYFTGSSTSTVINKTGPIVMPDKSFNPYFTGSSTSTILVFPFVAVQVWFQSLFYWKFYFNWATNPEKYMLLMFQSLFYWKFYFNGYRTTKRRPDELSFNPYFTGSSTSTLLTNEEIGQILTFQSLFYWKFYFNRLLLIVCKIVNTFQSLFYWKFYFNSQFHHIMKLNLNVSILILLEVLLQHSYPNLFRFMMKCFNPYFTGSSTSTWRQWSDWTREL